MTVDQLLEQVANFRKERDIIIAKKAGDYSRHYEVLSNFYEVAKITNRKPEEVILTHLATKISRLSTLFENLGPNEIPNNESIMDSIGDLANYADFLAVVHRRNSENPVERVSPLGHPANGATPYSLT